MKLSKYVPVDLTRIFRPNDTMYDYGNFVIILYKNVGILKVDVIVANIIQNPWVQLQSGI